MSFHKPPLLIALGLTLIFPFGCAGKQHSTQQAAMAIPAESPHHDERGREIQNLFADIQSMRRSQGLPLLAQNSPARPTSNSSTQKAKSAPEAASSSPEVDGITDEDDSENIATAAPVQRSVESVTIGAEEERSEAPPKLSCEQKCSLAKKICNNSERICELATELAGDSWAEEKCQSAEEACQEAQSLCEECQ